MRRLAVLAPAVAAAVAVLALGVPSAEGGYTATVADTAVTGGTTPYFTCNAAVLGETTNKAYFSWPLNDSAVLLGAGVADASGNSRPGTYTNTLTIVTGVTRGVTDTAVCPRDNGTVVTLDGSSGYLWENAQIAAPQTFTEEIWFKTSTAAGRLMGFGTAQTGASSQDDRHLYITSGGKLAFGVTNSGAVTLTSTATVTDGAWHYAAASLSSAGMRLYLDGALVASNTTTASTATTAGYWRVGYDSLTGWPGAPTSFFVKGNLAWASYYTYALSAAQVLAHYRAGTVAS